MTNVPAFATVTQLTVLSATPSGTQPHAAASATSTSRIATTQPQTLITTNAFANATEIVQKTVVDAPLTGLKTTAFAVATNLNIHSLKANLTGTRTHVTMSAMAPSAVMIHCYHTGTGLPAAASAMTRTEQPPAVETCPIGTMQPAHATAMLPPIVVTAHQQMPLRVPNGLSIPIAASANALSRTAAIPYLTGMLLSADVNATMTVKTTAQKMHLTGMPKSANAGVIKL